MLLCRVITTSAITRMAGKLELDSSRGKAAKMMNINGSPGTHKMFAKSGGAVPNEPFNFA